MEGEAGSVRRLTSDFQAVLNLGGATPPPPRGVAFNLMWRRARAQGLFHAQTDAELIRRAIRRGMAGPILYALAAAIALVFPFGAWLLFAGIPVFYSIPRRESTSAGA